MKKLISIMLVLIMLVSASVCVNAADSVELEFGKIANLTLGDVDADTKVSSTDLAALRKILVAAEDVISNVSDMNYDGFINVIDLIRLKKKTVGAEPVSIFENQAKALKSKILGAANNLPSVSGKTYHISPNGSTNPDGTSMRPYSYSQLINKQIALNSGDAVLLKRGNIYRGSFRVETSNLFIGAYGTGDKPVIYGSAMNYADANWNNEGNSVYSVSDVPSDAGLIVFNHGEGVGFKKETRAELKNDLDFWYDADSKKVYLYSDKTPDSYESVEIGVKGLSTKTADLMRIVVSGITVENIAFRYSGGHAISVATGNSDITIKNCDIGYIGGSYLSDSLRYGNGIELWCDISNALVENNWIHNIYDSGVTHQGGGQYNVSNVTVKENLIERCGLGSIEYWLSFGDSDGDGELDQQSKGYNITYTKNIMRYAGYGFGGEQRPVKDSSHIRSDVTCPNWIDLFNVTDNIFDISTGDLLEIGSTYATYPELTGNSYAQFSDRRLGVYKEFDIDDFGLFVKDTINYDFGDKTAEVYYY